MNEPTPRELHYAEFYGLADESDGRPVAWVHGNCQAESLRLQLDGPDLRTVRVPAVHELTPEDLPHLRRLTERTDVWVAQPVRADYRGLPVGTATLAEAMPDSRLVRVPVVRFAGLYPTQVTVRPPSDTSLDPPIVAYHDLDTLWEAAGHPAHQLHLDVDDVHEIAERSVAELRKRERHHRTVEVSDLFEHPGFEQMRTLNHPGNSVLLELAVRVRRELGLDDQVAPIGRELLDAVHSPRSPVVAEAFGLDGSEVRDAWLVDGEPVATDRVREAHLAWYSEHPDAVDAGLERYRDTLALFGLAA